MKMVQSIGFAVAIVSTLLTLAACGGATPTVIPPAGAASGLNTFIYIYSEN